jgi:hypothetical protein
MDEREHARLSEWIPAAFATFREAVEKGQVVDRPEGRSVRFIAPQGTLVSEIYDLFRDTDLLLSCARRDVQGDLGFLTPKRVLVAPYERCYHATAATNEPGIRSSGLRIGRDVQGAAARGGLYSDSEQYIHASLSEEQALVWYYDRFGQDQRGVVLAVDLHAAGIRLLGDPRSDGGIIEATRIDHRHILPQTRYLPAIEEMKAGLAQAGWTWEEHETQPLIRATVRGCTRSFWGPSRAGAWLAFSAAAQQVGLVKWPAGRPCSGAETANG